MIFIPLLHSRIRGWGIQGTSLKVLEAETYVTPLSSPLSRLQAKARYRLAASGQARVISRECEKKKRTPPQGNR